MRNYSLSELRNKNYNELYQIIEEERLLYKNSSIYNYTLTRKELIDVILKYRSREKDNKIYTYEDLIIFQKFIDENGIEKESYMYIEIFDELIIYENIDIYDNENLLVSIDSHHNFSNIVFLVNQNNYIYSILKLSYIKEENSKKIYYLNYYSDLSRISLDFDINSENLYLLFLENNFDINSNDKFYFEKRYIKKVDIIKSEKNLNNEYIYLENGIILNNNLRIYDDFLVINILKKDNLEYIMLNNFEKSYEYKKANVFSENENYIFNISNLLNSNILKYFFNDKFEKIVLNKNSLILSNVNNIIKFINYKNKSVCNKVFYINEVSKNYQYNYDILNNFKYKSIFFVIFYFVKKCIKNSIEKIDMSLNNFLIIFIEDNSFSISSNNFSILENRNRYNINIKTEILSIGDVFTNFNIKNIIKNYLKNNIVKKFNLKNKIINIFDLKIDSNKIEYIFFDEYNFSKIDYLFNEESLNYIVNILFDYLFIENNDLIYLEEILKDKLFLNNFLLKVKINSKKLKNKVYEMAIFEFNRYFNKIKLIEFLKKYKHIKIIGKLCKNNELLSAFKEYLPGKLLVDVSKDLDIFKDIFYEYEEDIKYGKIDLNYEYKDLIIVYNIFYINYKNEKILVLNTDSKKYEKFDIFSKSKDLIIEVENMELSKITKHIINLDLEYLKKDELEILDEIENLYNIKFIQSELLDDIKEDILRCLIIYDNKKIHIIFLVRKSFQTHMCILEIC